MISQAFIALTALSAPLAMAARPSPGGALSTLSGEAADMRQLLTERVRKERTTPCSSSTNMPLLTAAAAAECHVARCRQRSMVRSGVMRLQQRCGLHAGGDDGGRVRKGTRGDRGERSGERRERGNNDGEDEDTMTEATTEDRGMVERIGGACDPRSHTALLSADLDTAQPPPPRVLNDVFHVSC